MISLGARRFALEKRLQALENRLTETQIRAAAAEAIFATTAALVLRALPASHLDNVMRELRANIGAQAAATSGSPVDLQHLALRGEERAHSLLDEIEVIARKPIEAAKANKFASRK